MALPESKYFSPPLPVPGEYKPLITPDELVSGLADGSKILDVGCGSGSFNYSANPDIEIHACDLLPPSPVLDLPNVHYRQVSADTLDYPPDSFDLLIMNFVLEHTEKPGHIIKLAHDVLKPGGTLYLSVPIASHFEDRSFRGYDRFLKILTFKPFDRIEHIQLFSEEKLISLAIKSGFTPVVKAFVPAGFGWIHGNIEELSKSPGLKNRIKLGLCRWNLLMVKIWLNTLRLFKSGDPRHHANILCTFRKSSLPAQKSIKELIGKIPSRHFTHSCGQCGLPINIHQEEIQSRKKASHWKCPRCESLNIL